MAQAFSGRSLTAVARARNRASSYGICGVQSNIVTVLLRVHRVSATSIIPPMLHTLYNESNVK